MAKETKVYKGLAYHFIKFLLRLVSPFVFGYTTKSKYKIKKGESVVVISNHQTDFDAILMHLSFNKILRTLTTDNVFKKGIGGHFVKRFGCFPKRKGAMDLKSNMDMMRLVRKKESLIIFPEGNRSYAEFQYYVNEGFGKILKILKTTIIIFTFHGGTGRYPRFAKKPRRGKFYGEITRIMPYEEYKDIPDEELTKLIMDSIKVYDSESGELYKYKARAEFLERELFVCPKCGKHSHLISKGHNIVCEECGFEATFNENLSFSSEDPSFKFEKMLDWYNYQIRYVRDMKIEKGELIFKDSNIVLKTTNPYEKSRLLYEGDMKLYEDKLVFGDITYDIHDISVSSPLSGKKLLFTIGDDEFVVVGHDRFNPLKYILMFNKLDTKMKLNNLDNYFRLEEQHE